MFDVVISVFICYAACPISARYKWDRGDIAADREWGGWDAFVLVTLLIKKIDL